MERKFSLEEIQGFYPKHRVINTDHHFLIKDYFNFGDFKLSAQIRQTQPLFKNGRPLLPTQPFSIHETDFSAAIGTSADCLHVQAWFGTLYAASAIHSEEILAFGDVTNVDTFLAIASYDHTQDWFRTGLPDDIAITRNANKFIKQYNPTTGAGRDIWLLSLSTAYIRPLWQQCMYQRQIIIDKSDQILKTTSFPTSKTVANASDIPA